MAWSDFIISVIKVTMTIMFVILVPWMLYKGIVGKKSESVKIFFKYKVFRRKLNDNLIRESIKALEKNKELKPSEFAKNQMITYGYQPKKFGELCYVFEETKKAVVKK